MLASPEAARFVLVTHSHLFKPTYPKSKEKLIGSSALFFHQGHYHTRIRKLVQTSLSPESIKKLIPGIESEVLSSLESWVSPEQVVNAFHEMKKVGSRFLSDQIHVLFYLYYILSSVD
jgi:(+)-abscisic acid 8'-hydroxylase